MGLLSVIRFIVRHPMNRSHWRSSIWRFLRWQVGSRLVPGAVLFEWVNGARLLVRPGDTTLTGNIYTGLYEYAEMAFTLHLLREDDTFVDVGANAGSYTVLACAAAGARGLAFEPIPEVFARLLENVRLNRLEGRVLCYNHAVGADRGRVSFSSAEPALGHVIPAGEGREGDILVDLLPLDLALGDVSPTLLKIDVEGYEHEVLKGATSTLTRGSLLGVILELNGSSRRYHCEESAIVKTMFGFGFRPFAYDPLSRTLHELPGKNGDSENTLFIRDLPRVEERLRSARRVSIFGTAI